MKKKLLYLAFVFLGFMPFFANASSFPRDSKSVHLSPSAAITSGTILTVPANQIYTILEVCVLKSSATVGVYSVSSSNYSNIFYYDSTGLTSNLSYCFHPIDKLLAGQTYTYTKPTSGRMNINIVYTSYDLQLVNEEPTFDENNANLLFEISNKITDIYNFFNGGRLADFLKWGLVGIYFFFSIMFVRFIWRFFFGYL